MLDHAGAGGGGASAPPKTCDSVKIRAKSVEIWAKCRQIAVCALILQKWHPKSKCRPFFGGHVFIYFFSGKLGKIWAKILRTPKNLPAPTPML